MIELERVAYQAMRVLFNRDGARFFTLDCEGRLCVWINKPVLNDGLWEKQEGKEGPLFKTGTSKESTPMLLEWDNEAEGFWIREGETLLTFTR